MSHPPPTILGVQRLIVALTATTTTRVSVCAVHPPVEAAGAMYDALKYSAECALLKKNSHNKCRLINVEQAISNRHPVSCYLGKCRHTTDMCPPLHNPECFVFLLHPCRTLTRRRWASLISLSSIMYIYILFCRGNNPVTRTLCSSLYSSLLFFFPSMLRTGTACRTYLGTACVLLTPRR